MRKDEREAYVEDCGERGAVQHHQIDDVSEKIFKRMEEDEEGSQGYTHEWSLILNIVKSFVGETIELVNLYTYDLVVVRDDKR